jgi:hypothetical protein
MYAFGLPLPDDCTTVVYGFARPVHATARVLRGGARFLACAVCGVACNACIATQGICNCMAFEWVGQGWWSPVQEQRRYALNIPATLTDAAATDATDDDDDDDTDTDDTDDADDCMNRLRL